MTFPAMPQFLSQNPRPRHERELTNDERRELLRDVEVLYRALHLLPTRSATVDLVNDDLRVNADGSIVPLGMCRHPASEEFEEIESTLDEAYGLVAQLLAELEEPLITLRVALTPWAPKR